jgi:anti-sigma-K factor RskA
VKNCDQFRELLDSYALGALDPEDRTTLEAHLATGCPDCAKAVEEARWLVSQLAYAAPEAAPSDMLKGRLMRTVRAEAQAQAKPHVMPAKSAIPFWLWAAVAGLLVFSIYSAWNTRRLENEIREAHDRTTALRAERQKAEEQLADAKREATIMMDPTSHKIALWGEHAHPETLEAKWHAQLGVCITGDKVPMPSANHVLQLWFIPKDKDAKPRPSAMVRPDATGKLMLYVSAPPQSMDDTKAIAITEEPAGGSGWPTTPILWSGNVS